MVIEELVAKLGWRISGQSEVQKFVRELERVKKAAKDLSKGFKINLGGNSAVSQTARHFELLAINARRARLEMERISRVRYPRGGFGGHFMPPGYHPGRRPGGGGSGGGVHPGYAGAAGYAAARIAPGPAAVAALGVVATKTFANREQAATDLGITAEQAKERVAADVETFRKQAVALGTSPQGQIDVARIYAAAGLDYNTAVGAVVPTARTAKAAGSELEPVAEAGVAAINNLKIAVSDLPQAFDIMAKGAKAGQIELKQLARYLPETAAAGQKVGLKNLPGLTDIVAAMEIGRKQTGLASEAANNLKNFFEKMTSDEVAKAFSKKGINLEKLFKANEKKGKTWFDTAIEAIENYTKGDPFRLNELIGDMQARSGINAILQNRGEFESLRKTLRTDAAGTVDTDFARATNTLTGDFDKLSASINRLLGQLGEFGSDRVRQGLQGITEAAEANSNISAKNKAASDQLLRDFGSAPGKGDTDDWNWWAAGSKANTPWSSPPRKPLTPGQFGANYGKSPFGSLTDRAKWGASAGQMPGHIDPGALQNRFGADWMSKGLQQTTNNITHNNDTGNDHRTQSVTINQTVNGVAGVAAAAAEGAKSGLSSLGASVAKSSSTPTTTQTAP